MVSGNFIWLALLIMIIIILAILMLSKEKIKGAMKTEERGKPRIRVKGAISGDEGQTGSEVAPAAGPPVSGEMSGFDFSAMQPRVAVVKRYGTLIDALKALRKVPIQANMTAREIGGLLRVRGYPDDETSKLTAGFERAMYSAREITPADWERFSALADTIENYSGGAR